MLNNYQKLIVEITGCNEPDAAEIEDIMRNDILHSTLDWVPLPLFKKTAKEAFEMLKFLQSDEGKEYMAKLNLLYC